MRITDLIEIPASINPNIKPAHQSTMLSILGSPRENLNDKCQQPTNKALLAQLVLGDLGVFRVYGLKPAVDDLTEIFEEIKNEQGEVFDVLGYSGMLCTRLVRGSDTAISNHAWGTAIDLNLDGKLDIPGNNLVQRGLALIAPIFNRRGWYWGAGFGREDAMHFEVGDDRIRQWHTEGLLMGRAPHVEEDTLALGDRGPEVLALQKRLQELGFPLKPDGIFGPITRATLVSFQSSRALRPTGMLDADTAAALEEQEETEMILRRGSSGNAVKQWQAFLLQQGFSEVGTPDGDFGPKTRAATRAFQERHGLVPDGVVGPKTRAEAEALGLGSTPPTPGTPPASGAPEAKLRRMKNSELTADVIQQASLLLQANVGKPIGTQIPFTSAGSPLVGVLEWHYDERRGKHKGFSVFVPVA